MSGFWETSEDVEGTSGSCPQASFWAADEEHSIQPQHKHSEWPRERIETEYNMETLLTEHTQPEPQKIETSKPSEEEMLSTDPPLKKRKTYRGSPSYIDTTIPWRYRQHPCPAELCSRDRGHDGYCVVDMRYKLNVDLTGKEMYKFIHAEKQTHQRTTELFWAVADKKEQRSDKQLSALVEPLLSAHNKRKLGDFVIRDSAQLRKQLEVLKSEVRRLESRLDNLDYSIGEEMDKVGDKVEAMKLHFDLEIGKIKDKYELAVKNAEKEVQEKVKDYESFMMRACKSLVAPYWVLRKRREDPTTKELLFARKLRKKRAKRKEMTKHVMEFLHGSKEGGCYGAWSYLISCASTEMWESILQHYKKGKFLKAQIEKVTQKSLSSDEMMKMAIAQIYVGHISRRKYQFMTRIHDSYYDPEQKKWIRRKAKVNGLDIKLAKSIPYIHVENFIKRLDMGPVMQIPNHMGVCRTVTSLAVMIVQLSLKVKHLHENLIWFNEQPYHFVMQFSDDGAPETKELTMSLGTLTCWNLGQKVRSRELQYFLHGLSVPEKAAIMSDLWTNHTTEMMRMEGSVYTICGQRCTFSFEPSADMSWQSWAANEVGQSSAYFSPYANVCSSTKATINATLGEGPGHTWNPLGMEARIASVQKLRQFEANLPEDLSEKAQNTRKREFLSKNKTRVLGMPRIGKFVNQLRPEPLHAEINGWQYLLNIVYREALRRNTMNKILAVIAAPPTKPRKQHKLLKKMPVFGQMEDVNSDDETEYVRGTGSWNGSEATVNTDASFWEEEVENDNTEQEDDTGMLRGCGIPALAKQIVEAFNENKNAKRLHFRLIGPQSVALARNWHRVCEALKTPDESARDRLLRLALYKLGLCLREAASLFQKSTCDDVAIVKVKTLLQMYFNIHVLFFGPQYVNVTTWTLGYALPYHMKKLYDTYKVGYGITSMQAREAENAGMKQDLGRTNRSRSTMGDNGKWWQVCRWNYVRTFYLPEHHPIPSNYKPDSDSRMPNHRGVDVCRECGKKVQLDETCEECESEEMMLITQSAIRGMLLPRVSQILNEPEVGDNESDYEAELEDMDPAVWDDDNVCVLQQHDRQEEAYRDFRESSDDEEEEKDEVGDENDEEFDDMDFGADEDLRQTSFLDSIQLVSGKKKSAKVLCDIEEESEIQETPTVSSLDDSYESTNASTSEENQGLGNDVRKEYDMQHTTSVLKTNSDSGIVASYSGRSVLKNSDSRIQSSVLKNSDSGIEASSSNRLRKSYKSYARSKSQDPDESQSNETEFKFTRTTGSQEMRNSGVYDEKEEGKLPAKPGSGLVNSRNNSGITSKRMESDDGNNTNRRLQSQTAEDKLGKTVDTYSRRDESKMVTEGGSLLYGGVSMNKSPSESPSDSVSSLLLKEFGASSARARFSVDGVNSSVVSTVDTVYNGNASVLGHNDRSSVVSWDIFGEDEDIDGF